MLTSLPERVAQLKEMALFRGLSEAQVEEVAARLQDHILPANKLLYGPGDRAENFYIVVSGRLLHQEVAEGQRTGEYLLEPGDPFGAEAILAETERQAAVSALKDTHLLYLPKRDFLSVVTTYPEVAESLNHLLAGRQLLAEVEFNFLEPSEVVHFVARKHIGYLWFRFTRSMLLAIVGMLAFLMAINLGSGGLHFYAVMAGGLLLFAAVALGIWEALDWRNDYYLITNLRVVWLEQVLLRSSSRIEAPLANIQAVNVHTTLIGRLLGFGDIVVRTITGTVLMPSVGAPMLTKHLIEDYAARTKKDGRQARHDSIRSAVRESLGLEQSAPAPSSPRPTLTMVDTSERFSLFKTRTVRGDTIIYHKHWFSLLSSLALPAVFAVAVLVGVPFVFGGFPSSGFGWLLSFAAFVAPLTFIAYRVLDWQNDVYLVTPDTLIDSDKKPLGSEVTRSAPLANVLSLENHKSSLIGILLNFGVVRIKVGDTSLDFENVANPAQVQQDIFARMEALKAKLERTQADDERKRMTEWLRVYEQERGLRGEEPPASEAVE
jgi:hypothetical protein